MKPSGSPLELVLSAYCIWLLIAHLSQSFKQWRFVQKGWNDRPDKALMLISIPRLKQWQFLLTNGVFCLSLVAIAVQFQTKVFLTIALISYFLYFGQILVMANVRKKTNIIPMLLGVLLVAPNIQNIDHPTYDMTIWLLQAIIIQVYMSSGIEKIRRSGISWANGKSMQSYLLKHYAWNDRKFALYLGQRPGLCQLLSWATLLFEFTIGLILIFPSLSPLYVTIGLLFHLTTSVAMKIYYIVYFVPAYLFLLVNFL